MSLESITNEIREEISKLNEVLNLLEGGGNHTAKGARRSGGRRKLSAAGRQRIAAAQRARWAKIRAGKK